MVPPHTPPLFQSGALLLSYKSITLRGAINRAGCDTGICCRRIPTRGLVSVTGLEPASTRLRTPLPIQLGHTDKNIGTDKRTRTAASSLRGRGTNHYPMSA